MTIQRLPPAANPTSVLLEVNPKLTPYFAKFYQDLKLDGDTPETFLLRYMKTRVIDHYQIDLKRNELKTQNDTNDSAVVAIIDDANSMYTEVD